MKQLKEGFTLVELLIVISLIAILSVAVLSTLNPIEQTNKARDAKFQNDAAEALSAMERYYASQQYYPWDDDVWGTGAGADESVALGLTSRMPGFGVCAGSTYDAETTSCAGTDSKYGELIKMDELKSSFAQKDPFLDTISTDLNRLYLFKEAGAGGSVYICFVPKAKANRKLSSKLKDLGITSTDGVPTKVDSVTTQAQIDAETWVNRTNSFFKCVPQ